MLGLALVAMLGSPASPVRIPSGSYAPLYAAAGEARVAVAAFSIDREPVTRREFEHFVIANPQWRRGTIAGVFAEPGYLADWPSATAAGDDAADRPVTDVSWFAAKAFCKARGGRLPTVDEWEYVAAANRTKRDATRDPSRVAELVAIYSGRAGRRPGSVGRSAPNAFGVADLHELVWEWVDDFNSVLVSDDSRQMGAGGDERDRHLYCASSAIGASDPSNYAAFLRYAFRSGLTGRTTTRSLGFRCAYA